MHRPPVTAALGSIVIAPPVPFEHLVMFPLVLREEAQPGGGGDGCFLRITDAETGTITFATALFLGAVGTAWSHVSPGVGLGQDLRLSGQGITGAARVRAAGAED